MKKIVVIISSLLLVTSLLIVSINYINYKKSKKTDNLLNEIKETEKQISKIKEEINLKDKENSDSSINSDKDKELQIWKKELEKVKDLDNEIKEEYFNKLKEFETKVINNETNKKIAYLTFDDGPYYNTYKVLDILDRYDVKATFFTTTVNKQYCYDNKSYNCFLLYKEYATRGHTIANHTYTHAIRKGLYASTESFMEALINQENHIKTYSNGYVTNIVRFPGGSSSSGKLKQSIISELRKRGYGWVDWTAGDGDGGKLKSNE